MKIFKLHKLNKHQKADMEALVQECLKADGLERTIYPDNDINFYADLDSFYLLYDNRKLVSALAIFEPLEKEAEITAYTLPSERKKGYFKALLHKAVKELIKYGLYRILLVVESKSVSGFSALKAFKTNYLKSEYLLFFCFDRRKEEGNNLIELRKLTREKQAQAAALSSEIFCTDIEETRDIIEISMNSQTMNCYGAYLEDKLIGICNISHGKEKASIFGFGIASSFQGKGYGRLFLNQVMNMLQKEEIKSITLHVGSENTRAFSLYTRIGFIIQTRYDYYEYIIKDVE